MDRIRIRINRKRSLKLALAIVVFLAVECVMFAFWRFGAYYPARAALPENSHTVTIVRPTLEFVKGYGVHDSDKIRFTFDGETYTLDRGNVPSSVPRASELISELENELSLTLVVKDDNNSVCAVSGEEKTYLSVEDFNAYQKAQSVTGTVLLAISELIVIIGFAGAIFLIRLNDD